MKRRTFIKICGGGTLALMADLPQGAAAAEAAGLDEAFRNPPSSAQARTWWHWMNGNMSEIGITRDLEAMKRVGCSGFQMFQVGSGIVKGPVDYGSPQHVQLLQHAAREANRLGLEFAMHNCPGWSSSGGPWISERPDLSMQVLTWAETNVSGGQRVNVRLPQPPARSVTSSTGTRPYYKDAMVLALPAAAGEAAQPIRVTTNSGPVDLKLLNTGDPATGIEIRPPEGGGTGFLQLEFAQPIEVRSIALAASAIAAAGGARGARAGGGAGGFAPGGGVLTLEASNDGVQFQRIADLPAGGGLGGGRGGVLPIPTTTNLPTTRARYFRLVSAQPRRVSWIQLSSTSRVLNWPGKANFGAAGGRGGQAVVSAVEPAGAFIDPASILDISQSMDAQGQLNWQAPAGNWTVLRIGHTTTGAVNSPGPDGGVGLECDKFSKEAYDYHFESYFGKLFDVIAPLAAKGLAAALVDSYETGLQNWTAKFPEEFQKRRGYDLKRYMPAILGRVVGSPEISDRFLWDLRKTQAELMQENYYARFQEDCHKRGMRSFIEPYDPGNFDEMPTGQYADMVMGEFWLGQANHHSVKLVASVGHVYGKQIIGAESFTGQSKWQEHPYCMKALGDFMYTQGLNNYVFHRYAHQPHPDVAPGMTMGPWGWHFDRTNTWFDKSATWLKYVARAQNMLRQGLFVGDLLYFTGEDSPQVAPPLAQLLPPPPPGYDWDTVDAGAIQTRVKIENGRIVLPDGMSYRVLVLRDNTKLSLPLLRKIRDLVNEGMTLVVNSKPEQAPSLTNYPNCDTEVRRTVAEVWGDLNGTTVTERAFGKGRVFWVKDMRAVLDKLAIKPDFEFTAKTADAPIHWIHRQAGDADIYFLATRRRKAEDLVCTFRVNGKQPEFWDAVTGEMTKVATFETVDGRTRVPIHLDPAGSIFVVFRSPAPARSFQQIARDGAALVTTQPFTVPAPGLHRNVTSNFTISLWVKPDMEGAVPTIAATPAGGPGFGGGGGGAGVTFAIYPPAGETLYGANHAACGLVATRTGLAVYERAAGNPVPVAAARVPLAGWTHVAVVYRDGTPSLYINGKPAAAGQAQKSGKIVHPGLGEAHDAPMDFMGQMTEPQLFPEALSDVRVQELAAAAFPSPDEPPAFEPAGAAKAELLFWRDGKYTLRDNTGRTTPVAISGIGEPVEIKGPWKVSFPPNLGAPPEVTLPELKSLHKHEQEGVKYFSGTATYARKFTVPARAKVAGRRVYLDLGRVEVIAEVKVNGKPVGNVWKPPYRLDITDVVRAGINDLEVQVANLWPNRLIGDEQQPPEYEYGGGGGGGGGQPGGTATGGITKIPDWYAQGKPKPPSKRIAFTTWKWYSKDDPLFESGLLGPVRLRIAVRKPIEV
jgi:hypothetical protein